MFTIQPIDTERKTEFYEELDKQLHALFEGESNALANLSNCAALLFHSMPDLNWLGFYLFFNNELVLGPFQGKPACVRISVGKGVCGTAAQKRETVVVDNVHEFPGHIACDSASNAEIVVPMVKNEQLVGVLDIDSPKFNRFDEEDARGLERIVRTLLQKSDI